MEGNQMTTTKLIEKYGWEKTALFNIRKKHLTEGTHYEKVTLGTHFEIDYTYSGVQAIKKYLEPRKCKEEGCESEPARGSPYCYEHSSSRKEALNRESRSTDKPGKFVLSLGIPMRAIMLPTDAYRGGGGIDEQSILPRRSRRGLR